MRSYGTRMIASCGVLAVSAGAAILLGIAPGIWVFCALPAALLLGSWAGRAR